MERYTKFQYDVITGGFPCIDISRLGSKTGLQGEHSSLWWEMLETIRILRPRYAIVENVADLTNRGLDEVLGSLAKIGYDAEWQMLSAVAFGANHQRKRIFIIAYPNRTSFGNSRFGERQIFQIGPKKDEIIRKQIQSKYFGNDQPGISRAADGIPDRMDRLKCLGRAIVPGIAEYIGELIVNQNNE